MSNLRLNDKISRKSGPRSSRREKQSLKYYSSLDNEIEIDPEIANDIAMFITSWLILIKI